MKEFKESALVFKFSDQWEVYQLDNEADYRNKICKQIPETRSIDFIGFNEKENLLQRAKTNMATRQKGLRSRLTWLTSNVCILNTRNYNNEVEGMEMSPKCL